MLIMFFVVFGGFKLFNGTFSRAFEAGGVELLIQKLEKFFYRVNEVLIKRTRSFNQIKGRLWIPVVCVVHAYVTIGTTISLSQCVFGFILKDISGVIMLRMKHT